VIASTRRLEHTGEGKKKEEGKKEEAHTFYFEGRKVVKRGKNVMTSIAGIFLRHSKEGTLSEWREGSRSKERGKKRKRKLLQERFSTDLRKDKAPETLSSLTNNKGGG